MLQVWTVQLILVSFIFSLINTFPLYQPEQSRYNGYNPEENLGVNIFLTEGDILVNRKRSVEFQYYKTWYNRSVPYIFDPSLTTEDQALVISAIRGIQNSSCIQFNRRNGEKDYIRFIKPSTGCYSPVGRSGGMQDVGLGVGCFAHGTIQHEILHALGLWHEQSRWDRDEYITVMWDNIPREHHINFGTRTVSESHEIFLTMPYDYGSIMHYSNNTFAIDRYKPTLVPKQDLPRGVVMGQRVGLSQGDMDKLHALYRCDIRNCSEPVSLTNGQITGSDNYVGAKIGYACNVGFTLIGARERICRDIGEWSGQTPLCLVSNLATPLHYCNFDDITSLFCSRWTQATDDDLNWDSQTGPTQSEGTGPNWDHTLSTVYGGYVYIEASNRIPKQKARLVSPLLTMNSDRVCLVFFTYMYGSSMGNLSVFMNTSGTFNSIESNFLTSLRGDQGQIWKQVFLVLQTDQRPFTITFEGSVGNGYMSDIAIDDIIIGDCSDFKPLALLGRSQLQCTNSVALISFKKLIAERSRNQDKSHVI